MSENDRYSLNQLLALCSVAVLTPALRLLPTQSARLAGRGGWLSVLLALPAAAAYGLLLWRFAARRREGESLSALWKRAAGARTGTLLLALCGLWLTFYAGFSLRAGAERLITTVYPTGRRAVFVLTLGLPAACAAAGPARTLARMGKLVLPMLVGVIVLMDMGSAVNRHAKENGCTIVREIGGHGCGNAFHEDPWVSYVSSPGTEMLMVPGMVFTIEPMVNLGKAAIREDKKNGWTIYTADGMPSAQWEIEVLVTETGHEVLCW